MTVSSEIDWVSRTVIDGGPALRELLSKQTPQAKRPAHVAAYAEMLLATWPKAPCHERAERLACRSGRPLTPRERKVLQLISLGHSNKGIAQLLSIAPETVKTHAKRIFARLGTSTRAAAVARGTTLRIVS